MPTRRPPIEGVSFGEGGGGRWRPHFEPFNDARDLLRSHIGAQAGEINVTETEIV
ncbi:MAG: hypothetical protein ACON36_06760 [Ilumatobacteraceae bacterium]